MRGSFSYTTSFKFFNYKPNFPSTNASLSLFFSEFVAKEQKNIVINNLDDEMHIAKTRGNVSSQMIPLLEKYNNSGTRISLLECNGCTIFSSSDLELT